MATGLAVVYGGREVHTRGNNFIHTQSGEKNPALIPAVAVDNERYNISASSSLENRALGLCGLPSSGTPTPLTRILEL